MRPPRMRVALFGRSLAGISLANAMERAGHTVEMLDDPAELGSFQALILAVGEARLDAACREACNASIRWRLMVASWRQSHPWQVGVGQYLRWMSWARTLLTSY